MLEVQEALTGILALLALHFLLIWYYARGLVGIIEELAFPSDDPIMTSSLKEPVFEYEESEEAIEEDAIPEVFAYEEPTNIDPNHGHDLDHIEEVEKEMAVMSDEEWAEMEARAKKHPVATSILYEVGNYTESGEATLRQIKGMRKDDVIGICDIHGLDTEGTKAQLIERIKENAA